MGATPEQTSDKPVTENTGEVGSSPTPQRGDHPMFWGDLDFNPMADGDPPHKF